MDYTILDKAAKGVVAAAKPLKLHIRKLTAREIKESLEGWLSSRSLKKWPVKLFGRSAPKSWTFAILSSLRNKAAAIQSGKLDWILRTALPLRDDFSIFLDGKKLPPSKIAKEKIATWILGRDIRELPKPKDVVVRLDRNVPASSASYFGLYHPTLGRVTGYAEAYKDVLTTGKSIEIGRSYGFFVYVRGRLINIEDEYFGIDSNLLRHGTFSRFRLVVYIDKLDEELRSTREAIREGPAYDAARNLLHSIFNYVRPKIEEAIEAESSGSRMSRKLSGSPASLSRRPIIELARAALGGHAHPRLVRVPVDLNPTQQQEFIGELERRAEAPSGFVTDVQLTYALTTEDGIALFDTETCVLRINALHPFIGSFSGDRAPQRRRGRQGTHLQPLVSG